jgi:hypothetical protein
MKTDTLLTHHPKEASFGFLSSPIQYEDHSPLLYRAIQCEGKAQVLECLPDELNAMSSNSSITKKNFFFFFF